MKGSELMDKAKIMNNFDCMISDLDGAAGRLIVTAMSGNEEVKTAMRMVSDTSLQLGFMAEEFEEIFEPEEGRKEGSEIVCYVKSRREIPRGDRCLICEKGIWVNDQYYVTHNKSYVGFIHKKCIRKEVT